MGSDRVRKRPLRIPRRTFLYGRDTYTSDERIRARLHRVLQSSPRSLFHPYRYQLPPPRFRASIRPQRPIKSLIRASEKRSDDLVNSHDLHVLHYEGFGKNPLKKHKFSPDAGAPTHQTTSLSRNVRAPRSDVRKCANA